MHIHLLAVGTRMPDWVNAGYQEYARRMPPEMSLLLNEIAPVHRGRGSDTAKAVEEEGRRVLAAVPRDTEVIAMEVEGKPWSTGQLAGQMERWRQQGGDVALLVGGADGLSAECRTRAQGQWSLSPLTLPHPLVRVILAEQLYRASTILSGHPYHRG